MTLRSSVLRDRSGSSTVQMLVLVCCLSLAGVAGVRLLRSGIARRASCAGQQIASLSLAGAAPCSERGTDGLPPSMSGAIGRPPGPGADPPPGPRADPRRQARLEDLAQRAAGQREAIQEELQDVRRRLEELRSHEDRDGILERIGDALPVVDSRDESEAEEIDRLERLEGQLEGLLGESEATHQQRQFLAFSADPGDNRLIEVVGDLSTADRVVIHIPGMNTDLGDYADGGDDDVTHLHDELEDVSSENIAVISFMNYNVPDDILEAANGRGADSGIDPLQDLVADLHDLGLSSDQLAVVAHSYGSVVTGHTMQDGLDVGTVVTVGSPGMAGGADDRDDLGSPEVDLWSAAANNDVVPYLPAHGEDPSADGFGAHGFDIGDASGHSNYFEEGSLSLENIARIAAGTSPR